MSVNCIWFGIPFPPLPGGPQCHIKLVQVFPSHTPERHPQPLDPHRLLQMV